MWELDFISENDFRTHVANTIQHYGEKLVPYNIEKFNSNIIDPIKLIFDKSIFGFSWEEIVKNEIFRQRDKANNNDIGYFHQRIFQYFKDCVVPSTGWDVIYAPDGGVEVPECGRVKTVYVEMKNKHNTMNSSASGKTYIKMQGQLLKDDDCVCCLVEAIAKKSQNVTWSVSVDGSQQRHRRIRRVSMDEFYYMVTGCRDAFYKMCKALPGVIEDVIAESRIAVVPNDTAYQELQKIAENKQGSFAMALYMLGFGEYYGFEQQ